MKNVTWTYLGPDGRRSVVDLKHGVKSGNLIMFANKKVLLIDFEVFGDKTYTFFINDELCKVHVHKNNGGFAYQFKIDEEVDTPLNRWKKKKRKRAFRMNAIVVTGVCLILVGSIFSFFIYKHMFNVRDIGRNGLVTLAEFALGDYKYLGKSYNAKGVYRFRKAEYDIYLNLKKNRSGALINPAGLPVKNGDEFFLTFSYWRPDNYRLSFHRPTVRQIERYRQRLLGKYKATDPQLDVDAFHCLFDETFITKGVSGLATMFRFPEGKILSKPSGDRTVLLGSQKCR